MRHPVRGGVFIFYWIRKEKREGKMVFSHSPKLLVELGLLTTMIILSSCLASPAAPVREAEQTVAEQAATQAELEAQVKEAVSAWEEAYQAGDLDRLIEIYADDAVSMPPGVPILEGKAAIEADFRQFFKEFKVERQFSLVDLEMSGDMAVRRGEWTQTFTPKAGGESVTQVGKCLVVFKRFGDEWKAIMEIWNYDQ
jgi:uncharacterized protein (TIGR02246 family)